jgi:hypothetical protein
LQYMRLNIRPLLILALGCAAHAQDHHDWQSLTKLQAGDKIRLTLKTGSSTDAFQSFTPEELKAGMLTAKKEDVLKIERIGPGGWSRGKKAALGAAIGFGGGFAVGAAATGCNNRQIGICISRGAGGAVVGAAGAVVGAGIGALLPTHGKELIYSAK